MSRAGGIGRPGGVGGVGVIPAVVEQNLFDHATTTFVGSNEIGVAVNLGFVFTSAVTGEVRSVYFWKTAADAAMARTVGIFSTVGTLIGSGTSTGEAAGPGWQSVTLDAPVPISALTLYVAGVFFPQGAYPFQAAVFTTPVVNGNVIGESESAAGGNGRYAYAASLAYPGVNAGGGSFGVDVGFYS